MSRLKPCAAGAWVVGVLLSLVGAPDADAHEVRPGYLEIRESETARYQVLWRRPARGDAVLAMAPLFPVTCVESSRASRRTEAFLEESWTLDCDHPLSGRKIQIAGLETTLVDVLVRVELMSGESSTRLLRGESTSFVVTGTATSYEVAREYFVLGVEHILLGIDHLLFVLGLLLILSGWRRLLAAITAFTIAHSITLALASLGVVHVPQAPVEAVIALSIVFLATEYVHGLKGEPGWTSQRPWTVAFVVGLLHGLGFAGALAEVGLPQSELPTALLFFNVGVEAGQLAFVAFVLATLGALARVKRAWPEWLPVTAAYALGTTAAAWFVERTLALLP